MGKKMLASNIISGTRAKIRGQETLLLLNSCSRKWQVGASQVQRLSQKKGTEELQKDLSRLGEGAAQRQMGFHK